MKTRKTAGERREEIVDIAIRHFAQRGYHAASTEAMASDAGISQPYLFRLFRTKRELFLACHEVCHEAITKTFMDAAVGATPEERLEAMGQSYHGLLEDRTMLQFQMQSYAASGDDEVRAKVRQNYRELFAAVAERSGAEPEEVWRFFAAGMLLNVAAMLGLDELVDPAFEPK